MENKKKVPTNTITRDIKDLAAPTGNIYESVVILYKRANQIAVAEKKELMKKLDEFRGDRDTMEEVFENKERSHRRIRKRRPVLPQGPERQPHRHQRRVRQCFTVSPSAITF